MHPFQTLPIYDIPDSQISASSGSPDNQYWIFISYDEHKDPQLMDFLSKILASIEINLDTNVYLLPMKTAERIYVHKSIPEDCEEKYILCFGIPPEGIGLSIKNDLYQIVQLNKHAFLFGDFLSTIQTDPNKKRALWESLQSIKSKKEN